MFRIASGHIEGIQKRQSIYEKNSNQLQVKQNAL